MLSEIFLGAFKWLTGGFLDTIAKAWVVKVQSDADLSKSGVTADRDVMLKQLDINIEKARLAAEQRRDDRGSPWTAWMMPAIAIPTIAHYAAVAFDSNVLFGHVPGSWQVPVMPGEFGGTYEGAIIFAIVGIDRAAALVRRFK